MAGAWLEAVELAEKLKVIPFFHLLICFCAKGYSSVAQFITTRKTSWKLTIADRRLFDMMCVA